MKKIWMKQENHLNYGWKDPYMDEYYKIKNNNKTPKIPNNNNNNNVASSY
jgi:hypothetical protein